MSSATKPEQLSDKDALRAEGGDTVSSTLPSEHDDHEFILPSPTPTRRNRTFSASERASAASVQHGKIKTFCRQKGYGMIQPNSGGENIFLHISDIDGEIVPKEGDEVIYKTIAMPPKMEKMQAVHCQIVAMKSGGHDHWEAREVVVPIPE
ncbi:hypothetical protein RvY_09278 [Ramazzottius varieornatus]|uniref:CSD domain-containing protein n=1 Tax=Ramazzottius varieornatus TaxID=947166 RepID=A0A1D1VB98_RAMVA|nr:hypothetical protein RvY_09278 [Ramazzottius varieornatus]